MRALKFLTWLDVRRLIRKQTAYGSHLPDCINGINCFSDALEIIIVNLDDQKAAESILEEWFNDWYQKERSIIQLDLGNAILPVEFLVESLNSSAPVECIPLLR